MTTFALALVLSITFAQEEVPVKTYGFASPKAEHESAMSEEAQVAAKVWIDTSTCKYVGPGVPFVKSRGVQAKVHVPEIFKIPTNACPGIPLKDPNISYCWSRVECENKNLRFRIHDAFCLATSAQTCLSAKECALASALTRTMPNQAISTSPGKKQSPFLGQEMRGWNRSKNQRYLWEPQDEEELNRMPGDSK